MQCSEVMLNLVFRCREVEPVAQAARLMRDENIGFVPVIGPEGRLIGVVTDRDLAIRILAEEKSATTPVRDVMTAGKLLTCRPDEDIRAVEQRMMDEKKSRAIVVNEFGAVIGIISLSDIAQVEKSPRRTGRLLKNIAQRETAVIPRH